MHQTPCVWLISGCPFGTKIVPPKFEVGRSKGGWVMAGLREDVNNSLLTGAKNLVKTQKKDMM
jgi:hypothetical protein